MVERPLLGDWRQKTYWGSLGYSTGLPPKSSPWWGPRRLHVPGTEEGSWHRLRPGCQGRTCQPGAEERPCGLVCRGTQGPLNRIPTWSQRSWRKRRQEWGKEQQKGSYSLGSPPGDSAGAPRSASRAIRYQRSRSSYIAPRPSSLSTPPRIWARKMAAGCGGSWGCQSEG